jgi:DeoR/GlpR family transcriptional regulator of sugar metabolism
MLNFERLDYIMQELRQRKFVKVDELAEKYYVSPSTIRRDLNTLAREGIVRRTYGGATLIEHPSSEIPFQVRRNDRTSEKNTIGQLAAAMVRDDQFLCLDATTTAAYMVRHLTDKKNLKIMTTSAQIALDCIDQLTSAQVYCTGGWMNSYLRGFTGEAARQRIAEFRPDILFFSARSLSLDDGITDVNEEDVFMKQQMLKSCRKAVFLCDHKKFDQTSYRVICDYDAIDCLVTDKRPPDVWLHTLESAGVEVVYPGKRQG